MDILHGYLSFSWNTDLHERLTCLWPPVLVCWEDFSLLTSLIPLLLVFPQLHDYGSYLPISVNEVKTTVEPWVTWVWTTWVYLYMNFFNSEYHSTTWPSVGWILRCGTVNTEGRLCVTLRLSTAQRMGTLNPHVVQGSTA